MGSAFSKKTFFTENCEQLIEKCHLVDILKQEHREILNEDIPYSCDEGFKAENWFKFRYLDTPIFNHNRVILPTDDGRNDFINANYVDWHKVKRRFLCTQAPLQETAGDFWMMVFTHGVRVIVMLTSLKKEDHTARYPYWNPKKGGKVIHGKFTIESLKVESFRYHVVTNLRVTDDTGASLDVKHFAYTDCHRKRLPRDYSSFLDFVLLVRNTQLEVDFDNMNGNASPMVVHCSAGLNRTGAFCAIDISFSQYDENATIDIPSVVCNLRKQRHNCLSDPQYYIFCYQIVWMYAKLIADNS